MNGVLGNGVPIESYEGLVRVVELILLPASDHLREDEWKVERKMT